MRFRYLTQQRAAKAQVSLRICANSPESSLLACTFLEIASFDCVFSQFLSSSFFGDYYFPFKWSGKALEIWYLDYKVFVWVIIKYVQINLQIKIIAFLWPFLYSAS